MGNEQSVVKKVVFGLTLGIFLVSFILTWILKKIPGVKKIL